MALTPSDEDYYGSPEYMQAIDRQREDQTLMAMPQGMRLLVHEYGMKAVREASGDKFHGVDLVILENKLEADRKHKQREFLRNTPCTEGGYRIEDDPRFFAGDDD